MEKLIILLLIPFFDCAQCITGNCENGYGTYKYSTGSTYTGNWMKGVQHGLGRLTLANGDCKSGEWLNNKMTGKGTYLWFDGDYYTGEWQNGQRTGLGYMVYSNGAKREGNFVNGEFITSTHAISTIYSKPPYNDPNYFSNLCTVVTIGTQVWASENLNVDKFRNGDAIKQAKTLDQWNLFIDKKEPAWCNYLFLDSMGTFYGKLYNWYAVIDSRGLAPIGFHISTIQDWETLLAFLEKEKWIINNGVDPITKIPAYALKSKNYWEYSVGIDKYGFGAIPGGILEINFRGQNYISTWWCSNRPKMGVGDMAYYINTITMWSNKQHIYRSNDQDVSWKRIQCNPELYGAPEDKVDEGYYVRCIKE